ncbi:MAG: hypothetical protein IT306_25440 [Chloroflexi bacterium]|nr:hypothetical protein [Chloroflexota bacterium]
MLITLDKDFGDLIVRDGRPHAGLLRLVVDSVVEQSQMIFDAIRLHPADVEAGSLVTVEEDRIRVRPK